MAKVDARRRGELLRGLFTTLLKYPDGMQAKDAIAALEKSMTLTEYEKGEYESGGQRFNKVVRFATIGPVKAGWMRKHKGVWAITEAGEEALAKFSDPEAFFQEASRLYHEWYDAQPEGVAAGDKDIDTASSARITYEEAEEQAWQEIRSYLEKIDPYELQDLVGALLEAMDYYVSWKSPPGKDGGLDIIAYTDPLGTKPPRIKVQVKRRKDNISVEELRSFLALINEDDVGIFVTTGGFTKDAELLARSQERRRITLIDGQKLVDLWTDYGAQINNQDWEYLPLQPIYFLVPGDY